MPRIILFVQTSDDKITVSDKIDCYIAADTLPDAKVQELVSTQKMVLCQGDNALDVCKKHNLDGVIKKIDVTKPLKAQIKSLREILKKKTLGVIIPARRHEAMLAGEVEPDFAAFYSTENGNNAEFLSWYNELFLIPVAWVAKNKEEVVLDADFVIIEAKNFENFGC